jgi:hypothetical protein
MLNFELEPDLGRLTLTRTMSFRPRGRLGILDSYAVLPLHNFVFGEMPSGIRAAAESHRRRQETSSSDSLPSTVDSPGSGYGRARLWLGISAVGTFVTLATSGLLFDLPGRIQPSIDATIAGQARALGGFVLIYAAIQLPFDLLGGYLLPKRFGRTHPSFPRYLISLARGVTSHAALLFLAALALLLAGRWGGSVGTVAAGLSISLLLTPIERTALQESDALRIAEVQSSDEGFTGGVVGVLRPRLQIVPSRWREVLGAEGFEVAVSRRSLAVQTGSWRRGRAVAVLFTLTGLAIAAGLVGSTRLGTAGGTIEFSLWFTLWSFLGLLTLPTLSRRGVIEVDERARMEGQSPEKLRKTTRQLDDLQDGEPIRPTLIETIFHPIPSVQNRLEGAHLGGRLGFWDVARSSVYLSLAGLGLLGRAVHCNCGRPSLWVFLPTD